MCSLCRGEMKRLCRDAMKRLCRGEMKRLCRDAMKRLCRGEMKCLCRDAMKRLCRDAMHCVSTAKPNSCSKKHKKWPILSRNRQKLILFYAILYPYAVLYLQIIHFFYRDLEVPNYHIPSSGFLLFLLK